MLTAQDAARIHQEHNPSLTPQEQARREVDRLVRGYVQVTALKGTSLDLTLARVDLTTEIAQEFNRLGYGVTYELLDGIPNGKMRVTWPQVPWQGPKPPPPADPPQVMKVRTPWPARLLRRLGFT